MRRAVAAAAIALLAGATSADAAKISPQKRAERAVVAEVKDAYALLAYGDNPYIKAKCKPLTKKRFRCDWEGRVDYGSGGTEWYGKARATILSRSVDVVLSKVKCYGDGCDVGS